MPAHISHELRAVLQIYGSRRMQEEVVHHVSMQHVSSFLGSPCSSSCEWGCTEWAWWYAKLAMLRAIERQNTHRPHLYIDFWSTVYAVARSCRADRRYLRTWSMEPNYNLKSLPYHFSRNRSLIRLSFIGDYYTSRGAHFDTELTLIRNWGSHSKILRFSWKKGILNWIFFPVTKNYKLQQQHNLSIFHFRENGATSEMYSGDQAIFWISLSIFVKSLKNCKWQAKKM